MTNFTEFNCLSRDISSTEVTNQSFWQITLSDGAPAVATVFGIYFLVAFTWNLFIIVTFLMKRKMLREAANILLLNLAIADLTVALTQMFFSMVTEASEEFVFGKTDVSRCGMCNFVGVFFMLLYGVSMHTLAALSFDRFLLLYKPFRYKKIMTQRNTIFLVLAIWLIAGFLSIPPVIGFGQIEFNRRFGSCIPRFTGNNEQSNLSNYYYVAYVALESLFPIVIIAMCSFWTYRFVNKFLTRNYIRRSSFYTRRNSDGVKQLRHEDTRYHHQQQQLVKVFGALLVSNLISWLPVLIVVIVVGVLSAEKVPDAVYVIGWICFLTAPVVHPIIESFFVKDMRLVVCKGLAQARGAGSFIARSTTGMFGNKDIEIANEKADESEYVSRRQIKFFGGRSRVMSTVSTTTEVTDLPPLNSHDITPSPSVTQTVQGASKAALLAEVQLRDNADKSPDSNAAKTERRITFSDESSSTANTSIESPVMRNGIRKSVLKSPRPNDKNYLTPLSELDAENSLDSSSGEGSVFNSPGSPLHGDRLLGLLEKEPENSVEQGMSTGLENRITLVPVRTKLDSNEENSNSESTSDLKLLETVYSERRESWTLV